MGAGVETTTIGVAVGAGGLVGSVKKGVGVGVAAAVCCCGACVGVAVGLTVLVLVFEFEVVFDEVLELFEGVVFWFTGT